MSQAKLDVEQALRPSSLQIKVRRRGAGAEPERKKKGGFLWFLGNLFRSTQEVVVMEAGQSAAGGLAGLTGAFSRALAVLTSSPVGLFSLVAGLGILGTLAVSMFQDRASHNGRAADMNVDFGRGEAAPAESWDGDTAKRPDKGSLDSLKDAIRNDSYLHDEPAAAPPAETKPAPVAEAKAEVAPAPPPAPPDFPSFPKLDDAVKSVAQVAGKFKSTPGIKEMQNLGGSGASGGIMQPFKKLGDEFNPKPLFGRPGVEAMGVLGRNKKRPNVVATLSQRVNGGGARGGALNGLLAANSLSRRATRAFQSDDMRGMAGTSFDGASAPRGNAGAVAGISGPGLGSGSRTMASLDKIGSSGSETPPTPNPQKPAETNPDSAKKADDAQKMAMLGMLMGLLAQMLQAMQKKKEAAAAQAQSQAALGNATQIGNSIGTDISNGAAVNGMVGSATQIIASGGK